MRIARRFNAGNHAGRESSPNGTTESCFVALHSAVPSGLIAARRIPGTKVPGYSHPVPPGRSRIRKEAMNHAQCGERFVRLKVPYTARKAGIPTQRTPSPAELLHHPSLRPPRPLRFKNNALKCSLSEAFSDYKASSGLVISPRIARLQTFQLPESLHRV